MIRVNGRLLLLVLVTLWVAGCSSLGIETPEQKQKQAKVEVTWPYAKDAILLEVESSPDLNRHANQSHAVVLGVVQLDDEKSFPKILTDTGTVVDLLTTGKLSAGVLQMDRYVVNPGERHVVKIDRVQDTRFVGLLAGYYEFEPARAARYFRIPLNMQSSGLIMKDYKAEPSVLALRLVLGSQRIVNALSLTHDPDQRATKELLPTTNPPAEVALSPAGSKSAAPYTGTLIKLGR